MSILVKILTNKKDRQMKHKLLIIAITTIVLTIPFKMMAYDFSAVSPSGHTLYYNIVAGDAMVTYPQSNMYGTNYWVDHTKPTGNLIIPETVVYNGVTRTVIKIDNCAFYNCDGISSVDIPGTITFMYGAFSGCTGISSIICRATTPPTMSSYPSVDNFSSISPNIVVKVPCGTSSSYSSAAGWSHFTNYVEYIVSPNHTITPQSSNISWGTADLYCAGGGNGGVIATPYYGYHFNHWNDNDTSNPRIITSLTHHTTYTAYFAKNQYNVNGSVQNLNTNDTSICGSITGYGPALYQDVINLQAEPSPHYHFAYWGGLNDSTDQVGYNNCYVYVNGPRNIVAYFEGDTVILNVNTADITMGTVSGGGYTTYHSQRTIQAFANPGYSFSHWNDGNTDSIRTIIVNVNDTYTAYFSRNKYRIYAFADTTCGAVMQSDDSVYYNDFITLTAIPKEHYVFSHWISEWDTINVSNNPWEFQVKHDDWIYACFSVKQYYVTVMTDGGGIGYIDYLWDTCNWDNNHSAYNYMSQVTLHAIPHEGNRFDQWQDGVTYNPRTITVTSDTTFIAYFTSSQGINNEVKLLDVNVYTDKQHIIVEGASNNKVTLYDMNGRMLATKQGNYSPLRFKISISGTYMIKVGDYPARKVVVIR